MYNLYGDLMKKYIFILTLCLLIVVFITTYNIELVGADSGFDSSYDSSFDSSSSFDSDSTDGGDIFVLIYLCMEYPQIVLVMVAVFAFIIISKNKKQKKIISNAINSKLELLDPNNFKEEKRLEIDAFNIYKTIQYAWMNFDEELIRKNTTDEIYNMYLMQLDTLKLKNQQNLMYDIKYLGSKIKNRFEENGQETIVINMKVSCYDFIIDTKTNKVVRGNSDKINYYNYELTFVKTVDNKKLDICPRCGAPVTLNNSGVCEYCKSTLISDNYTLILSKKEMISQK